VNIFSLNIEITLCISMGECAVSYLAGIADMLNTRNICVSTVKSRCSWIYSTNTCLEILSTYSMNIYA